jgi:isopenicillin-N epimerase
LPVMSADEILGALDSQVGESVRVLQASLVSSSSALRLPIAELGAWVKRRGGTFVVDAAHGPGHLQVAQLADHADVAFGTLHKWLPLPRGVGFIWASAALQADIRPAEVSLNWDAEEFAARFSWPGTFDPVPRLCLPDAIDQFNRWQHTGLIAEAEKWAEEMSVALEGIGAVPTGGASTLAPRLRAFILSGVSLPELNATLDMHGIRAWTGVDAAGETLLRIATHVYSSGDDLHRLVDAIASVRG